MDRSTGTTRTGTAASTALAAVAMLAGPLVIYLAAASVAAAADGVPLGRVSCFDLAAGPTRRRSAWPPRSP